MSDNYKTVTLNSLTNLMSNDVKSVREESNHFTYDDILDVVTSLKVVKESELVNMLSISNVISALEGFKFEKAIRLMDLFTKGKLNFKYYELLLSMINKIN